MLAWWEYAIVVGAGLAAAAVAAERLAWGRRWASRGVWAVALLLALAWPALAWLGWWPPRAWGVNERVAELAGPDGMEILGLARAPLSSAVESYLPWIWVAATSFLLIAALLSQRRLVASCREGRVARVAGARVWVHATDGPATFGLWRPRIIVPYWVMAGAPRERRLVVLHELHHRRAGDLGLIWLGNVIVSLMPWNPAAWFMSGRLRRAVEIDCDRRIAGRLVDRRDYGALLLHTATMRSPASSLASGLLARRGLLRRRIEHIVRGADIPERRAWGLLAPAVLCLVAVAFAPAPEGPEVVREVGATATPESVLVRSAAVGTFKALQVAPAPAVAKTPDPGAVNGAVGRGAEREEGAAEGVATSQYRYAGTIRAVGRR